MTEILLGLALAGPILIGTVATVAGSTGLCLVGILGAAVPSTRDTMASHAGTCAALLALGLAVLAIPAAAFTLIP